MPSSPKPPRVPPKCRKSSPLLRLNLMFEAEIIRIRKQYPVVLNLPTAPVPVGGDLFDRFYWSYETLRESLDFVKFRLVGRDRPSSFEELCNIPDKEFIFNPKPQKTKEPKRLLVAVFPPASSLCLSPSHQCTTGKVKTRTTVPPMATSE